MLQAPRRLVHRARLYLIAQNEYDNEQMQVQKQQEQEATEALRKAQQQH